MPLQLYKIASTELSTTTSTITFSSIPSGYTDLKLVFSGRTNYNGYNWFYIKLNSTSGNSRTVWGNGSTTGSYVGSGASTPNVAMSYLGGTNVTANTFSNVECYIPNYTSSNNKSMSIDFTSENNATSGWVNLTAGIVNTASAVTSITLLCDSGVDFVQYSSATLYGIL
jgi:hypothetical protein